MSKKHTQTLKVLLLAGFMSVAITMPAFAISDNAGGTDNQSDNSNQSDSSQSNSSGKLDDKKKQICERNSNRIRNMFTNMNSLGEGRLNLFDNIAQKVQKFYSDNKLNVENYDQLVQEINSTKEAAQLAIQAAVSTSSQFGCDTDDPKGTVNQYKVQVKTQVQALKDYRTAVKDLISAVQLAAQSSSEEGQE
ncbi:MAG: hypothetical protein PHO93_02645 [Candidatus Saccharimonadaceae bacterium]|nr:hypothetical protein [Candidatus Saccharimonadaceae bacterium]